MPLLLWLALDLAIAAPPIDANAVCAAPSPVALSPTVAKRVGRRAGAGCPSLIGAQAVADYMKAFAVVRRELARAEVADQLARHVGARWLIIEDGNDFAVYDTESKGFVDPGVFAVGGAHPPSDPSEQAYQAAYRALRARLNDEARSHLDRCLELNPEHIGCHWELGWLHWVEEDWPSVVASWQTVQRLDPQHPELDRWLPQALQKAGPVTEPQPSAASETETVAPSDAHADDAPPQPSHCTDSETVGFSCPIEDTLLSLCWTDAGREQLQVRLGPPGQPALIWPDETTPAVAQPFTWRPDADAFLRSGPTASPMPSLTVAFAVNGNRYTVFDERRDDGQRHQGLRVDIAGLTEVELPCSQPAEPPLTGLRAPD